MDMGKQECALKTLPYVSAAYVYMSIAPRLISCTYLYIYSFKKCVFSITYTYTLFAVW